MQINFVYDPSVANAPAGFKQAFGTAATELQSVITSPGTVTIEVGFGDINGGTPLAAGDLAKGGPSAGITMTYDRLVAELRANADSAVDQRVLASLPATAPANILTYFVSNAQEKAWGLRAPQANGIDGIVGVSSGYAFATTADRVVQPGQFDLIGIAEHEISHALGRIYGDGPLELVNYSAPSVYANPNSGGFFSLDGGKTDLSDFAAAPGDTADWSNVGKTSDNFSYTTFPGMANFITPVDKQLVDAIGFSTDPNAAKNFDVLDTSTSVAHYTNGAAYDGPVTGLTSEVILANAGNINIGDNGSGNADNFNITAYTPNSFIHTGIGMDAIDVSAAGGGNILDGGGGSNFLTGGAYVAGSPDHDIFYLDDRNPSGNLWSTIVNFHMADQATVWGVNEKDFKLDWLPDQGAAGFTGLDAVFSAAGHPSAALTLTGYGFAQLRDGSLRVAYGRTDDLPGIPGSDYMTITGSAHFGS